MSTNFDTTYRAMRLVRWYPKSWRDRYGVEFAELLEQEILDQPRSWRRTADIVHKGIVARLGESGLAHSSFDAPHRRRNATSTVVLLSTMFVLFAVHLWSQAMVQWNEVPWWPASTATSVWLGVATSFLIILVVSVIATLVVTVNRAVRAIATTSRGEIVGPLAAIGASLVLIAIPVHQSLANVIARNGIQWGNPGRAIKQLAGACVVATDQVARFWEHPSAYLRLHTLDVGLEPLFALALAWGVSAIIRRTDFPLWDHRLSRSLTAVLSVSMGVFLLSYLGWIVSGGPNKGVLFGLPESVGARSLQISVMVIMAIAALRAVLLWRSHAPRELTTRTA